MTRETRKNAGLLLVIMPTVVYGGVSLLGLLVGHMHGYQDNPVRHDLWRAGHAHAGVLLILSLVALMYVDETDLPAAGKTLVRWCFPLSAIFLPAAMFLSILSPESGRPSALIYLAYVGAAVLVTGMIVLGIGLIRARTSRP